MVNLHTPMPDSFSTDSLENWLRVLETRHPTTIDLGLDRVGQAWRNLGCPRPAKQVFIVAGTNGKGSTVAYIDAMVRALSYRCGSYTSPHVFRYNERVRMGDRHSCDEVSDEAMVAALNAIERARADIGLSYFEQGTLAAFLLMEQAKLDFAVLEVGLGGRLDAVNLIDADCAVITPIGLDHQAYLGPDRETIGREKAGILRHARPLICGEAEPPASVLKFARELAVPVQRLDQEFRVVEQGNGLLWQSTSQTVPLPKPPLLGPHQYNNLATAVAAVTTLLPGAVLRPHQLAAGISSVRLAGRLQPHPDDSRVVVDVGHNPLAAEVLRKMLQADGTRAGICVLAMLRDKDAAEVVRILDGQVEQWYCAGLAGERGRSGAELAELVAGISSRQCVKVFDGVEDALFAAVQNATESARILVFGSFVTATQALNCSLPERG